MKALRIGFGVLGLAMLLAGLYIGLVWTPPEREMGDVYRILYMHVPLMWMALLAGTFNAACAVTYLFNASWKADALAEASGEVGLVLGSIGMVLGSIWGRPTWGVYWSWDPRLTTVAIMLVSYAGYMALRKFIEDPERRAVWSSVTAIIVFADLPIVYFSVKWWKSLHQVQSSPKTVDPQMVFSLRWHAFALLFTMIFFIWNRYRIAMANREQEVALPDALPPAQPVQGAV